MRHTKTTSKQTDLEDLKAYVDTSLPLAEHIHKAIKATVSAAKAERHHHDVDNAIKAGKHALEDKKLAKKNAASPRPKR